LVVPRVDDALAIPTSGGDAPQDAPACPLDRRSA